MQHVINLNDPLHFSIPYFTGSLWFIKGRKKIIIIKRTKEQKLKASTSKFNNSQISVKHMPSKP